MFDQSQRGVNCGEKKEILLLRKEIDRSLPPLLKSNLILRWISFCDWTTDSSQTGKIIIQQLRYYSEVFRMRLAMTEADADSSDSDTFVWLAVLFSSGRNERVPFAIIALSPIVQKSEMGWSIWTRSNRADFCFRSAEKPNWFQTFEPLSNDILMSNDDVIWNACFIPSEAKTFVGGKFSGEQKGMSRTWRALVMMTSSTFAQYLLRSKLVLFLREEELSLALRFASWKSLFLSDTDDLHPTKTRPHLTEVQTSDSIHKRSGC